METHCYFQRHMGCKASLSLERLQPAISELFVQKKCPDRGPYVRYRARRTLPLPARITADVLPGEPAI
jgi:hypothetical protein